MVRPRNPMRGSARALRVQHAEAYRLHIIESVYPSHITGMTMSLLAAVVSKVRYPAVMLLVDDWPWSDFRAPFAIVAFSLLWSTRHATEAYVRHFESICGIVNWLGMLSRSSASRALPDFHWRYVRPISIFASAAGMRCEIRKQWPWTVLRLAVAGTVDAYVELDREALDGVKGTGTAHTDHLGPLGSLVSLVSSILYRFATKHVAHVAAHLALFFAVQIACEAHDTATFRRRVRAARERGGAAAPARGDLSARSAGTRREGESVRMRR